MPLSRRLLSLILLALVLAAVAAPAMAQRWPGPRGERSNAPQDSGHSSQNDSLSDAVRRIERSNRGQVLSAERMQYDGRDVNRIKVVDDEGRVRIYMDDAQNSPARRRGGSRNDDDDDDDEPRQRQRRRRDDDDD